MKRDRARREGRVGYAWGWARRGRGRWPPLRGDGSWRAGGERACAGALLWSVCQRGELARAIETPWAARST